MLENLFVGGLFYLPYGCELYAAKTYIIGVFFGFLTGICFSFLAHELRKVTNKRRARINTESGSIFLTLFAAVAVLGVLASGINMVMRGPVTTMADVTKRTLAENNIMTASKLAIVSASGQANSGDCDSDGYVEPISYRDAGASTKPTGGGYLPSTIGAAQTDPWQTQYGYCVWDAGSQTVSNNVAGCGGTAAKRLNGAPNGTQYVVAVISAGKDRMFQTTCNAYVDANNDGQPDTPLLSKAAGSDDISTGYTYAEATTIGGALWALKSGAPTTATISKDLEVTGGATFSGSLKLGKGLILPADPGNDSLTGPCNAANDQQIRINKASSPPKLEICDFAGGSTTWQPISGGGMSGGMIVAFSQATCPTNWTEYTLARGRFLRGIDNGAGNDPDGTRTAGAVQVDAFQNITGTFKVAGTSGGIDGVSGVFYNLDSNKTYPSGGTSTASIVAVAGFDASRVARTSAETRPKNVAVTYCQYTGPVVSGGGGGGGPGTGFVAGINGSVQYNNNGTISGDTKFIYDGANLIVTGAIQSAASSGNGLSVYDRNGNGKNSVLYRDGDITRIWDSTGGDRMSINAGTGNVGVGMTPGGYKLQVNGDIYATSWLRSNGNTGWYNETYGGGWYMLDTTYLRAYNNKYIYTGGVIQADAGMRTGGNYVTWGNTGWYNESYGGGWYMSDGTWIRAHGDKNVYTPNTMLAGYMQANNMYAPNNVTAYSMTANAINSNAPGDGYRIAVDATNASGVYGAAIRAYSTTTGYYCFLGSANGAITCNGPAYGTSDARLKKDIHPLQQKEGLDAIMAIQPVRYLWKDERKNKTHPNGEIGFIAQNVEKVLPDMVAEFIEQKPEEVSSTPDHARKGADPKSTPVLKPIDPTLDKNGDPVDPRLFKHKSLTYDRMVVPVVLAIQQLKHQLDTLRQEIMALFDRHTEEIANLTARLDAIEADNKELRARLEEELMHDDSCAYAM